MQQPWYSGVQLALGVCLSLQTWMCRSKTQEVQHQNRAPSSSVALGTDHYVCLKVIPNHLPAERDLNAWLFQMPYDIRNKVLLMSKSALEKSMCWNHSHSFSLCPVLSVSAASFPYATANTVHFLPLLPHSPPQDTARWFFDNSSCLLPSPPLPCSFPVSINIWIYVPIHHGQYSLSIFLKRQQLQMFKMRPNLDKTISQRLLWILLNCYELLPPGKMYPVPKWLAALALLDKFHSYQDNISSSTCNIVWLQSGWGYSYQGLCSPWMCVALKPTEFSRQKTPNCRNSSLALPISF